MPTDHNEWQCAECGTVIGVQNPRQCPTCGETVFHPVQTDAPGESQTGEVRTEDFDVDEALNDIAERRPDPDPEPEPPTESDSSSKSGDEDIDTSESGGLLARLRSFFS